MSSSRAASALCDGCATGTTGFCARLTAALLDEIVREGRVVRVDGDVTAAGPETALILRRGMVKLSHTLADGRQQIVDFLLPGDVLFSSPGDESDLRVVIASSEAEACALPMSHLLDLGGAESAARATLFSAVLGEISRKNQQVLMLGRKRSDERVASFLLDLAGKLAPPGSREPSFVLPMSRAEIADYLCLTTETVSRVFSVLREAGMIGLPRPNQVVLRNVEALATVAAGGANLTVK